MPISNLSSVAAASVPVVSRRGLQLLSSVFNRASDEDLKAVFALIERETSIRPEDIAEEKLTPEQWATLKDFEHQHEERLLAKLDTIADAEISRMEAANADRQHARDTQAAREDSDGWLANNFVYLYAFLITILTFGFLGWVVFGPVFDGPGDRLSAADAAKARVVDTVIGFLLGVSLSAVIQFFFGSSQGSSRKNRTIENFIHRGEGREPGGSR